MANNSLPNRARHALQDSQHSQEQPFTAKSRTATPSNVVQLRASGRGTPNTVNEKVPPRRVPNQARRSREYLTQKEVIALIETARKVGRHGHRDATLILLAYRSILAFKWEGRIAAITLGTVDGDPGIRPSSHIFVGSKAPWHDIVDDLPQFQEWPPEGE